MGFFDTLKERAKANVKTIVLPETEEKLKADYVIVAMSGDYVQRGTPALISKHTRAEMALRCGADLVLEMPVSISTASAEAFAMGGVSLLDSLGVVDIHVLCEKDYILQ